MKEYKIGEIVKKYGNKYIVKEFDITTGLWKCSLCGFNNGRCDPVEGSENCFSQYRSDNKEIYFEKIKLKYKWSKILKENVVVHNPSDELLQEADKIGLNWFNEKKYTEWKPEEDNPCYEFYKGLQSNYGFYARNGFTIYEDHEVLKKKYKKVNV